MLCPRECCQDRGHRRREFLRIAALALDIGQGNATNRCSDHWHQPVNFGDHDIGRHTLPQSLPDHSLQFFNAVVGRENSGHTAGGTGDRLVAIIIRIAEVVVGDQSQSLDPFAWHTHQMEHR